MVNRDKVINWRWGFLRPYLLIGFVESCIAAFMLLAVPPDPKNAWFLGYSIFRIGTFAVVLLGTLVVFAVYCKLLRDLRWRGALLGWLERLVENYRWFFPLWLVSFGLYIISPFVYLVLQPQPNAQIVRLFPVVVLICVWSIQGALLLWGFLRHVPVPQVRRETSRFFISIEPRKVLIGLLSLVVLLVLFDLIGNSIKAVEPNPKLIRVLRKFFLDVENSFPTSFNASLLLVSGLMFGLIAFLKSNTRGKFVFHWAFLAFLFPFLALDEMIGLHELLNKPMRLLFNPDGIFTFAWVIAAFPLILLFSLLYLRFFLHFSRDYKKLLFLAMLLYVGGALGVELAGAGYFAAYGIRDMPYIFIAATEEMLELTGVIVLIYTLLRYIYEHFGRLDITIQPPHSD